MFGTLQDFEVFSPGTEAEWHTLANSERNSSRCLLDV